MTKDEISLRTKNMLAESLKKSMEKKPFEKITVTEILKDSNITRSTFYYHFEDIYSLMIWMFENECVQLMEKSKDFYTWSDGIELVLNYVRRNYEVCICALDSSSVGREYLKRLLFDSSLQIMLKFINSLEIPARDEDKRFIGAFYTRAMVSELICWMNEGMKYSTSEMIDLYEMAMGGAVKNALLKSTQKSHKQK